MFRRTSFCLTFLVIASLLSFAQRPGAQNSTTGSLGGSTGLGGIGPASSPGHSIDMVVHAVFPNDHPAGENIEVSLQALAGGIVATSFTNSEGQASFHNLTAGSYIIRLTGADIRDASSNEIVLDAYSFAANEYVYVHSVDEDKAKEGGSKGGVVSASDLNVPSKARKEFEKGNEAFAKGDMSKAAEFYQKAAEIYPKYAMAYNNLGAVYMQSHDKVHAREVWDKALEADPQLPSANVNMAKLDMLGNDYRGAIPLLQKALAGEPNQPEALLLMAQAKLMTGNMNEALLYARRVHATGEHLKFEASHLIAGRALEAQNHPNEARIEYEVLLKESPTGSAAEEAQKSLARLDSVAKK